MGEIRLACGCAPDPNGQRSETWSKRIRWMGGKWQRVPAIRIKARVQSTNARAKMEGKEFDLTARKTKDLEGGARKNGEFGD